MTESDPPLGCLPADLVLPLTARARRAHSVAALAAGSSAVGDRLRDLVREAARLTASATAQISVVADRQTALVIESRTGEADMSYFEGSSWAFEDTVCALALRLDGPLGICDAGSDARTSSLPSVTSGLVGSYLGAPVRDRDGDILAVLCVHNPDPRSWDERDAAALGQLAEQIGAELRALLMADVLEVTA